MKLDRRLVLAGILALKELDAGIVGRSIDDLDAAVVDTDWALKASLTQNDRIATEAVDNNPYRNFIAPCRSHRTRRAS